MFDIMMKKNKEWLRVYRMPGSKPGTVPWQNRDFGFKEGVGPWGNIIDFVPHVKALNVAGLALVDPIDSPAEIEYVDFEAETFIKGKKQSNSEVNK